MQCSPVFQPALFSHVNFKNESRMCAMKPSRGSKWRQMDHRVPLNFCVPVLTCLLRENVMRYQPYIKLISLLKYLQYLFLIQQNLPPQLYGSDQFSNPYYKTSQRLRRKLSVAFYLPSFWLTRSPISACSKRKFTKMHLLSLKCLSVHKLRQNPGTASFKEFLSWGIC